MIASSSAHSYDRSSVDPWEIIDLLRSKVITIVAWGLACGVAALILLHYARPVYASRALLEVAQDERDVNDGDSSDTLKTLELKLANQSLLLGVIRSQHLADDPDFTNSQTLPREVWNDFKADFSLGMTDAASKASAAPLSDAELVKILAKKVSVSIQRGSRLIAVTVEDHDPAKAQRLARAVVDEFFKQSSNAQYADSSSQRERLVAEAKRVGEAWHASEVKLQDYREKYQAVSLQDKQNIVVERLRDLNQQVEVARNARLAMETDETRVQKLGGDDPEQYLNIHSISALQEITDLRRAVSLQEAQVATLSQRYGPLHPTLIQAKSQLANLHQSLDSALKKAASQVSQTYQSLKDTEMALENALSAQERTALELDRIAIPYHALEREVQADSAAYQKVLDSIRQLDVSHGLMSEYDVDGSRIHLVESPLIPTSPVGPASKLWMTVAVVGGLFVGCGSALVSRALDHSVSSTDNAESFLGLPVLSTVPKSPHSRLRSGPLVTERPNSTEAESFRYLRSSLALMGHDDSKRAIVFTSAVPGEGKSYCSLNYAASLAQQGLRTLLIDGDLRRPHMQQIFTVLGRPSLQWMLAPRTPKPGLSDCIRDPSRFGEAILETAIGNLFVLGDARPESTAAELLARNGMAEVIERGLKEFDRVVIDTAPIIAVSDTLHIAKTVANICLVVHANKTPRRVVSRACQLLQERSNRQAIGVVLNKIGRDQSSSYNYYYSDKAYA